MVNLIEKLEYFTIFHSLTIAQVHWKDSFSKWWKMVKNGEHFMVNLVEKLANFTIFHHDLLPGLTYLHFDSFWRCAVVEQLI